MIPCVWTKHDRMFDCTALMWSLSMVHSHIVMLPSVLCPLPSFREWELQSTLLVAPPNFSQLCIKSVNHSCHHRYLCNVMNALLPRLTSLIVYPCLCHWLCIPSLYFLALYPYQPVYPSLYSLLRQQLYNPSSHFVVLVPLCGWLSIVANGGMYKGIFWGIEKYEIIQYHAHKEW